ncbi:MAG: HlyD family efflux transporter periplasmic adaptor subunit [Deltaproteobacteria bacterium]|nr:HlyD family efflux transporter periplasmic adaptor subunit [Deltaproteobacteria bacterium]MCW5806136.1 HlyD family efflux transporter periplasmic adaptor subunit [Deltaproteobacteria bacterium]
MTDLPRSKARPRVRRIVVVALGLAGLAALTFGIRWWANRAPSVSRGDLWIAAVQRGPLTLEVRGSGTLIPLEFRWASAPIGARVDKVLVQPGAQVTADTILVELANPDVELAALEAEREVAAAEGELARLAATLDGARLAQESTVTSLDADLVMANRRDTIDAAMAGKGVISDLESAESKDRAKQLAARVDFEKRRLGALRRGNTAQLDAQQAQVQRLRALAEFRKKQLDALHVRAGQSGVVQQVAVEVGQSIAAGGALAKVVVPDRLQARIRIPEVSMSDVTNGLKVAIDTRAGAVRGEVVRIDPAAQNGSVAVDVRFLEPLPRSSRPDQNVDGTIELARTGDVLHVARPAIGEAHSSASLFVISDGEARRVAVKFGRAALRDIEIAGGLREGDQVVLSDMSRWEGVDRLRID